MIWATLWSEGDVHVQLLDCKISSPTLKTWCRRRSKGVIALTPPTFSKYAQWLPKWISCSLKNQVNLRSSVGSWATWHGSTMLSPTVTSRWPAGLVIKVGSVNREQHVIRVFFMAIHIFYFYFVQSKHLTNNCKQMPNLVPDVNQNNLVTFVSASELIMHLFLWVSQSWICFYVSPNKREEKHTNKKKNLTITAGQICAYNLALFVSRQKAIIFPSSAQCTST